MLESDASMIATHGYMKIKRFLIRPFTSDLNWRQSQQNQTDFVQSYFSGKWYFRIIFVYPPKISFPCHLNGQGFKKLTFIDRNLLKNRRLQDPCWPGFPKRNVLYFYWDLLLRLALTVICEPVFFVPTLHESALFYYEVIIFTVPN